jgi:hypothetical protein
VRRADVACAERKVACAERGVACAERDVACVERDLAYDEGAAPFGERDAFPSAQVIPVAHRSAESVATAPAGCYQ